MMLWKKSVGESQVDCSTVMVREGRRRFALRQQMEDEGVGKTEHTAG